ncbi:MAG: penicillin-binding protein activator [Rhizobiaceae bacterium]|nr:penicillin-binding protein activator [Rhizobiaceae bacterium]MCV0407985.1 penicillin-binding protein activator [Rhizobiaceae bacterium]
MTRPAGTRGISLCGGWFATILLTIAIAGCQSASAPDVLELDGTRQADALEPADIPATEKLGSGPVAIGMLLPRSAGGEAGRDAAEFRDGAALAMSELGGDHITLTIYDTKGQAAQIGNNASEAIANGARLLIGPISANDVEAVKAMPASTRPAILSLAANSASTAPDIFTLVSDETDSALAGVGYAVESGKKKVLAIAPDTVPEREARRLGKGIAARGGEFLGAVTYTAGAVPDQTRSLAASADAFLLLGRDGAPGRSASALRATGAVRQDAVLVGTSAWSRQDHADPALNGAVLAIPNPSGLREISDRFRAAYGRSLSLEAAYAYDAIAIAAGIVRVMGADSLSSATLQARSGFKGTTGVFRFNQDGSVERRMPIYRIEAKRLKLVDAASDSF